MTENEMVDRIIKSLEEEPERWKFDDLTAWRGELYIWTDGCRCPYIWKPATVHLGFWNKRRLWRAVKEGCRRKAVLALTDLQGDADSETTADQHDCPTEG